MKTIELACSRPLHTLMLTLLTIAMLALGACNTTRGVGKDVEAAGEGIQNAADEVEEEIKD